MELSELPKIEDQDSPHAKDTYRTVKPPDRCVISYNFQQTNSVNVTHNLLIGMFSQNTKKTHKQQSFNSAQKQKNKLFSIMPNNKKIARQDEKVVSKVYDSKVVPRRYVNAVSPHKESGQSQNYGGVAEKTHLENAKNQIEKHSRLQFEDQDATIQQLNGSFSPKPKTFNENSQKQLSPYRNRPNNKRQKLQNRSRLQAEMEQSRQRTQIDGSYEVQNKEQKLRHKNISSKQAETKYNNHRNNPNGQLNSQSNINRNSHVKNRNKVGNVADQSKLNQSILTRNENEHAEQLQPVSERPSFERLENLTEQKIASRKEIQDEQLRQLEQIVRKQQGANFKKGYFKKSDSTKELLPFNAEIDPYRHQQSKYIRRASMSKNKGQNKMASMTEVNSFNHQLKSANNRGTIYNRGGVKNGERNQKMTGIGKENYSMQKQRKDRSGMPSIHQVRQSKAKEFSLNELTKNNKNVTSSAHANNTIHKETTGLRKVHDLKNNHNNNGAGRVTGQLQKQNELTHVGESKADLTENNVIKGFKVPGTSQIKSNTSPKGNSFSNAKQTAEKKETQIDPNKKSKIRREKPQNSTSIKKESIHSKQKSSNRSQKIEDQNKQSTVNRKNPNNRMSNDDTSRTIKNKSTFRQNKPIEAQNQLESNSSKTENSVQQLQNKPTIARNAKEKSHHFKNWKEAEIEKAIRESKDNKKRRDSQLSRDKKLQMTKKTSNLKPNKRKEKSAQIDLDAVEQDKFGLSAQKNVTLSKNKKAKAQKEGKKEKKKDQRIGEIKEESEKSIKSGSQDNQSEMQQQESGVEQNDENSLQQMSQVLKRSQQPLNLQNNQEQQVIKTSQHQPNLIVTPYNHPQAQTQQKGQTTQHGHQQMRVGNQLGQQMNEAEGVHQIQQLIEQNGELSIIDCPEINIQENRSPNSHRQNHSSRIKNQQNQQGCPSVVPIPSKMQNNLEQLLIATEELPPQFKISEPILAQVEQEFAWSKEQIEEYKVTQQHAAENASQHNLNQQQRKMKREEKSMKQQEMQKNCEGEEMEVNLPMLDLACTRQGSAIKKIGQQNETDYNQEQRDKIDQIAPLQTNKEEINKTEDFFTNNLKQFSKMTDLANLTSYQPIDKNIIHYTRAPILSFLYEMPNQFDNYNQPFFPSGQAHRLLTHIRQVSQIGVQAVDQAVSILLSIDPWIIERVFEPFEDKDGKIGIWLYCQGKWTLFLEKKESNFKKLLFDATTKALQLLKMQFQLENVLKLVSGVRIMRLRSSKKRIFNQLEFSLKKGHTLKALTSKHSKWGERLFTVSGVQVTKDNQNVLQIKEQNQTYWVKQSKFKEIFQHFLLICTRKSHFWTHRLIEHRDSHKTVISISSQVPAHGSITLFYPSAAPSNLLLYKQLQSKVLKFMGKIQQKSNQNGNLYFEFRLHGTYCIFLQSPVDCLLAVQSTTQLEINDPQYVVSHTLKNEQCEYVQLNHQLKKKNNNNSKQLNRSCETLSKLREKFINLVVQK